MSEQEYRAENSARLDATVACDLPEDEERFPN